MTPTIGSNGKNHMTSEQKLLEDRIQRMEEFMVRMTGLVETLAQNRSQSSLLTDAELADVLRAWLRADDENAAIE